MTIYRKVLGENSVSNIPFRALANNTARISDTMIWNSEWPFRLRHFQKVPNQQGQTIFYTAECDSQQAFGWGKNGDRKVAGKRTGKMVYAKTPRRDPATGKILRDKHGRIKYDVDRSRKVQQTIKKDPDQGVQSYPVNIQFYNVNVAGGEIPSVDKHPCKVYCGCQAYYFYFGWYNYINNCHLGKKPVPYKPVIPPSNRPPTNPNQLPGVCKHLIAFANQLTNGGEIE